MDKNKIVEYLENVVELEKQVYLQHNALNKLNAKINSLGYAKNIQAPVKPQDVGLDSDCIKNSSILGALFGGLLSLVIGFNLGCDEYSLCTLFNFIDVMITALVICIPAGAFIGCLIGLAIACSKRSRENNRLSIEHQNSIDRYEKMKDDDALRVKRELEQRSFLCSEYDVLYAQYEDTCRTRQRFYDTNIIYGKYHRDFAAVASFLDYFKSGRCSTLGENRGGDGAYNTYENELFHKIITNKLDLVIDNLNEIKQIQYSLAVAISEGNQISHDLVSATERLALAQEKTAENSAITAYSSQQAANELNQIKWLEIWGQM